MKIRLYYEGMKNDFQIQKEREIHVYHYNLMLRKGHNILKFMFMSLVNKINTNNRDSTDGESHDGIKIFIKYKIHLNGQNSLHFALSAMIHPSVIIRKY